MFVFPKLFFGDYFTNYIIKYRPGETLKMVYDTFRDKFLNNKYRTSVWRNIFLQAGIIDIITSKKRTWDGFEFENNGPIDMSIDFFKKKPVTIKYRGRI